MNPVLLSISITAAVATAIVAIYVAGHHFIPLDVTIEDDVQSTNWGPLLLTFPIFSWIGDAKGAALEALIFVAILVFNRRTWIFALGASFSGGWYVLVSHLIIRLRPTAAQVLQVTEHPGASSFPSGHTIFVAISRVYTGAHWPTDVLGAILIATAWLCFWTSLRWGFRPRPVDMRLVSARRGGAAR